MTGERLTVAQRGARLTTTLVVARPRVWRLLRGPFRRYFTRLAPRWDAIVGPGHLDALAAALVEVAPPRRALDVGTGTGAAAFLLAERFPEADVVGVDVSPAMVAAAAARTRPELAGRVRFREADAAELPVPSESFDLVVLANMIPFFDELARVLTARGTLLVCFSEGAGTPIWVPPKRLRAELERRGFMCFAGFAAGDATCLLARRSVGGAARPAEC